ncbi:hypothetical protein [Aeoliella sp.]|uniref:hypothetical protein n=1 Tax=Aeoliella sp. TaxID=2795800 RepID=UPI003CCBF796
MSNRLELPDDFQHLIEKREGERRQQTEQDSTVDPQQLPTGEERRKGERRKEDRSSS